MRFYETEKEFILLKNDEQAPDNAKLYTYRMHQYFSDVNFPQFDLLVGHFQSEYPVMDNSYFVYKGISCKLSQDLRDQPMIDFLNNLKAGVHEKKLEAMIFDSFKLYPEFAFNGILRNIEQLKRENKSLKESLDKIKVIVSTSE